jgi:hypothetical protein
LFVGVGVGCPKGDLGPTQAPRKGRAMATLGSNSESVLFATKVQK